MPQAILQDGAWPIAQQLGIERMRPGSALGKSVIEALHRVVEATLSVHVVWHMLHGIVKCGAETPERSPVGFWHKQSTRLGPAGTVAAKFLAGARDAVLKSFRFGLSRNVRALEDQLTKIWRAIE